MNRGKLVDIFTKYNLTKDDVFKHQHYTIITRSGIEKVQGLEKISINYEVIKCEPNFAVIKGIGKKDSVTIETFGSAIKGATFREGNTNSWYVMEIAEKRAMSRVVLKLTGLYELGVFGEDESEDFKRGKSEKLPIIEVKAGLEFNAIEFKKTKSTIQIYVTKGLTFEQIKAKMNVRYTSYTKDALIMIKNMTNEIT